VCPECGRPNTFGRVSPDPTRGFTVALLARAAAWCVLGAVLVTAVLVVARVL
jgi:hypothetical protein